MLDPLIMPVGALGNAGRSAFHLIRRLREELGVNTTCGASNVSFGLPNRHHITGTFLAMAIGAGMTSAITNPLEAPLMQALLMKATREIRDHRKIAIVTDESDQRDTKGHDEEQQIEEIREFRFGTDVIRSERSYDFGLVSSFEDLDALQRYQVHPDHQKVVALQRRFLREAKGQPLGR